MSSMESLLSVSVVFWSSIFIYIVWIDRKLSSLKKIIKSMEDKS